MALLQMSTNKQAQAETQTCQLDIKLENTIFFGDVGYFGVYCAESTNEWILKDYYLIWKSLREQSVQPPLH